MLHQRVSGHCGRSLNLVGVYSPLLCGEEDKLKFEALGLAADPIPYPVYLQRGSLIQSEVKRLKTFGLPNNFVEETLLAKPVLTYKLQPQTVPVKYIIAINDPPGDEDISTNKVIETRTLEMKAYRSLHEFVDGNKFIPGEQSDNIINFRVILGKATFSDMILWFKVEI